MDTHRSRTCGTPEQEQSQFVDVPILMFTYILAQIQKLRVRFKIVGIGRVRIGADPDASKGSVLVCGQLHPTYDHLCGERQL